jgi:hypothetical protein
MTAPWVVVARFGSVRERDGSGEVAWGFSPPIAARLPWCPLAGAAAGEGAGAAVNEIFGASWCLRCARAASQSAPFRRTQAPAATQTPTAMSRDRDRLEARAAIKVGGLL